MDISLTNAYLLYKGNLPVAHQSRYDRKRFVALLVKSLTKFACTSASDHHSSFNAHCSPGRPPNSSVRDVHRLSSSAERHYCRVCIAEKEDLTVKLINMACNVPPLCFTSSRDA